MGRRIGLVLAMGCLFPSVASAQGDGAERHFGRGEGLYRMERYAEAFREFERAGRHAVRADGAVEEELRYFLAMSAAQAGMADAEGLLEEYAAHYPQGPGIGQVLFELGNIASGAGTMPLQPGSMPGRMPTGCLRTMPTSIFSNTGIPVSRRTASKRLSGIWRASPSRAITTLTPST